MEEFGRDAAARQAAARLRRTFCLLPGSLASAAAFGEAPPLAPCLALSLVQLEPILAWPSRQRSLYIQKNMGNPLISRFNMLQ